MTNKQHIKEITAVRRQLAEALRRLKKTEHLLPELDVQVAESEANIMMATLAQKLITQQAIEDISDIVLEYARRLTHSAFGFVGFIDEESGNLVSPTLTRDIWEACDVPDKNIVFEKFMGLWGWVLTHKKPLLTNCPADDPRSSGLPPGHLPINRFLSVPALIGEDLVGQVALANSDHDYTELDLAVVKSLADLYALAVQQKRSQRALQESEELYRVTIDSISDAIFLVDDNGEFVFIGPNVDMIFGYSIQEVRKLGNISKLLGAHLYQSERLKRQGEIRNIEQAIIDQAGREHVLLVNVRQVDFKGGTVLYTCRDVTERKQAENDLVEVEKNYTALAENIPGMIYRAGPDWSVVVVSSKAEEISGYLPGEFITGQVNWFDLIHPEDRERVFRESAQLVTQPTRLSQVYRITRKDGSIGWVRDIKVSFLKQGCLSYVDGVVFDITEQKQAEEEKETLRLQLCQSQKLEALGRLAGGVAHDFNTLLGTIIGYGDMIKADIAENSRTRKDLEKLQEAAYSSKKLINHLMEFARTHKDERKTLPLALIVKESLPLLRSSLPTTVKIHMRIAAESACACVDPVQIRQVIMNLGMNAGQAIGPKGGDLEISLAEVCQGTGLAGLAKTQPGIYLRLTFRDTGCGMAPETVERLFEPFFTTKEIGKGCGLGLAVVYGIVKSHGGFITVKSKPGKGSRFDVYLPRSCTLLLTDVGR